VIHIGNAPCSWGVLEFDLEGGRAAYARVLDEMGQSGYAGTELGDWGFLPTDPGVLRRELSGRGLTLVGAFVPVALSLPARLDGGVEAALRSAELLASVEDAAPLVILSDENGSDPMRTRHAGRIRAQHGLSPQGWRVFAAGAEQVARAVRDRTGLRTVFHHHCAGFVETPAEIEQLLQLTDPELLGLCLDTGHLRFGGGDPRELLDRHGDRVWHVHFKDCDPAVASRARREGWDYFASVHHGVFCELGRGDVDFPGVTAALRRLGYRGWIVVEQDVLPGMGSPLESARANRRYLTEIGL
jgi:inosose dehydratase